MQACFHPGVCLECPGSVFGHVPFDALKLYKYARCLLARLRGLSSANGVGSSAPSSHTEL